MLCQSNYLESKFWDSFGVNLISNLRAPRFVQQLDECIQDQKHVQMSNIQKNKDEQRKTGNT